MGPVPTLQLGSRAGLAQWYHVRLTGERSGFDAWSWQPEMTPGILGHKRQKSAGDNESTLVLKPTDGQSHPKSETQCTNGPTK